MERRLYKVKLITEMLGTVPMDPKIYETYVESKKPEGNGENESLTVDKVEEKGWTGFHKDEKGLFIYEYMVKGFLKNAGNVMKESVGVKALRGKIDDFVFISPRRIYLGKDKADGVVERPLRAMTPAGPRVALARSDYVSEGTEFEFGITLMPHPQLSWKLLNELLSYGLLMGFGQFRNGGYGRFSVEEVIEL